MNQWGRSHAHHYIGMIGHKVYQYKICDLPDDLPELGTDLVAALASLYVHNFPHAGNKNRQVCKVS